MKTNVIWSEDAGNELVDIITYIKCNSGKITADRIYKKINTEIGKVCQNARSRRISPLLKQFGITAIHQVNVNPWIIYYRVDESIMEIISIIDGRRNLAEILYQKVIDGKIK